MPPRRFDPKALAPDAPLAALLAARHGPRGGPVTIEHDGRAIVARAGEPLAVALLAGGTDTLARSVKFHRPRGPMCLRGACDGCLVRLDGVPNVMACRVPARDGARIESQNSFPSAQIDVLRVTDWFFPKQFDHHHLMVGFGPAVNRAMQKFARRMAGMGTLPDTATAIAPPELLHCDVLVVGAGPAGLAAAAEASAGGASVLVLEEEATRGGMLRDDLSAPDAAARGCVRALGEMALARGARIRTGASVVATFDNATLAMTAERALLVRARARIFANGGHESVGSFEGNDLPGVYTARAATRALLEGVLVGDRVAVIGDAWPAHTLAASLATAGARVNFVPDARVQAATGSARVTGARVADAAGTSRDLKCDALVVATAPTPAYELLGEAGVTVQPDAASQCFAPLVHPDGRTDLDGVFAAGLLAGVHTHIELTEPSQPLTASGPVASGVRAAQAAREYLARGGA